MRVRRELCPQPAVILGLFRRAPSFRRCGCSIDTGRTPGEMTKIIGERTGRRFGVCIGVQAAIFIRTRGGCMLQLLWREEELPLTGKKGTPRAIESKKSGNDCR